MIEIPTAHIWCSSDRIYPTFGPVLRDSCLSSIREEIIHGGGHELPRSKDAVSILRTSNKTGNRYIGAGLSGKILHTTILQDQQVYSTSHPQASTSDK